MSGPRRTKIYEFLVHRDGERCFIGGEVGNSSLFVVDHWDNDNSNNDPPNLHLICRRMNYCKNPRRGNKGGNQSSVCVSENSDILMLGAPLPAALLKNHVAEPKFRHWLFEKVVRQGRLVVDDAIYSGAEVSHSSPVTIGRHLKKATSKAGIYRIVKDANNQEYVELRPEWNTFREIEEQRRKLEYWVKNWREFDLDPIPEPPSVAKMNGALTRENS